MASVFRDSPKNGNIKQAASKTRKARICRRERTKPYASEAKRKPDDVLRSRILIFGVDNFFATHIRLQRFGNHYAAVCLQVVFNKCDKHTGRRNDCVVQGVREFGFAVVVFIANGKTSRLRVR